MTLTNILDLTDSNTHLHIVNHNADTIRYYNPVTSFWSGLIQDLGDYLSCEVVSIAIDAFGQLVIIINTHSLMLAKQEAIIKEAAAKAARKARREARKNKS